eukprot:1188989-Prorocentrum_minimum.AAC.3
MLEYLESIQPFEKHRGGPGVHTLLKRNLHQVFPPVPPPIGPRLGARHGHVTDELSLLADELSLLINGFSLLTYGFTLLTNGFTLLTDGFTLLQVVMQTGLQAARDVVARQGDPHPAINVFFHECVKWKCEGWDR